MNVDELQSIINAFENTIEYLRITGINAKYLEAIRFTHIVLQSMIDRQKCRDNFLNSVSDKNGLVKYTIEDQKMFDEWTQGHYSEIWMRRK